MKKKPIHIAVTGAAGQIAYNFLFRLIQGELFGNDQSLVLHLLEIPAMLSSLQGVVMELEDCASPLLEGVFFGEDPYKIFKDVEFAILIGATPRGPGMERKELLSINGKIFSEQGQALNEVASRNVRVLVVGNPCNTNCLIALKNAPDISKKNFFAMMRLDQNRAINLIAKKAEVSVSQVSHVTIWGNHSSTQVPDLYHARINGRAALEIIQEKSWEDQFVKSVQQRGAQVIALRGRSSIGSPGKAIIDTLKDIMFPTNSGWYSLAIHTEGNPYGIDEDLVFSFPCKTLPTGEYEIITGLEWNESLKKMIAVTEQELLEERTLFRRGNA